MNGNTTLDIGLVGITGTGTISLIDYAGSIGGSSGFGGFSLSTLPPRVTAGLVNNPTTTSVDLVVTAFDVPRWIGNVSNVWDINTTSNWKEVTSGNVTKYLEASIPGDKVLFNDGPGVVSTTIDISTAVSPSLVTVDNSTLNYSFTSTSGGRITGPGGLLKKGTGTLTISTTGNDYTGGTTVENGRLVTAVNNALPTAGAITLTGGTLDLNTLGQDLSGALVVDGGSLVNGTINKSGANYDLRSGSVSASLTGAVGIDKTGAGNLILSGTHTFTGPVLISGGTLELGSADALAAQSVSTTAGNLGFSSGIGTFNVASVTAGNIALADTSASPVSLAIGGDNLNSTYSGSLSGVGKLVKNGSGTMTLSGTSSHTGGTIVNSGTLLLLANQTWTGGTQVETGAVLAFNSNSTSSAGLSGTVNLANGATVTTLAAGITGNPSVFVGANLALATGATATATSTAVGNGYSGAVFGDATSTLSVTGQTSFSAAGTSSFAKQFQTMDGTVRVESGSSLRFSATNLANGGDNTTFDVLGTLYTRNGGTVTLGALTGNGTIAGPGSAGSTTVNFVVGTKNTDTTYSGSIADNTNGQVSLIKAGTGTLTLTGSYTHLGATRVNSGVLNIKDTSFATSPALIATGARLAVEGGAVVSSNITLNGGVFDVTAATSTYSTSSAQTIATDATGGTILGNFLHDEGTLSAGGSAVAATLTGNGNFDVSGGSIVYTTSPSTLSGNDLINVTGTSTVSGTTTISLNTSLGVSAGTYTVLTAAGGVTGDTSAWVVDTTPFRLGSTGTATISGNSVVLNLSLAAPGAIKWAGTTDGNWDNATTANWYNASLPGSDKFYVSDAVSFSDTYDGVNAPTTTTVALNSIVAPSSVTVNSSLNYTIAGAGKITGTAGLTKSGSGVLTLTTANDYTGGTSINGGTINIGGNMSALGTGSVLLNNGALAGSNGSSATFSRPITVNTDGTISFDGAGVIRIDSNLAGTGTLHLTSTVASKSTDLGGVNSGFTGSVAVGSDSAVRFVAATAASGSTSYNLNASGSSLGLNIGGTSQVIPLGALSGVAGSVLRGHQSSNTGAAHTFEIGALNASTTFAGNVVDGAQGATVLPLSINKVGSGTLTFTGNNTYTGNTTVGKGTLVLGPAASGVVVTGAAGAILNGGKLVIDYTGGSSPKATLVDDGTLGIAANAAGGNVVGQLRTGLAADTTKAIGWLDDGASTFQARYTHKGDVNLSGTVDSLDFNAFVAAGNYGKTSGAIWANGDFDYNGKVNTIDFNNIAGNFGAAPITAPLPAASLGAVVPEPSTLGVIGIAAMGLISRRRRA